MNKFVFFFMLQSVCQNFMRMLSAKSEKKTSVRFTLSVKSGIKTICFVMRLSRGKPFVNFTLSLFCFLSYARSVDGVKYYYVHVS